MYRHHCHCDILPHPTITKTKLDVWKTRYSRPPCQPLSLALLSPSSRPRPRLTSPSSQQLTLASPHPLPLPSSPHPLELRIPNLHPMHGQDARARASAAVHMKSSSSWNLLCRPLILFVVLESASSCWNLLHCRRTCFAVAEPTSLIIHLVRCRCRVAVVLQSPSRHLGSRSSS